jgi:hypothetical protein
MMPLKSHICFVIAPIGRENSPERIRSDQVFRHVIAPAATECGYEAIRADNISEPGLITSQVIQHVVADPLVVADLTGRNPNVFYELALRHAIKKPVVQIIQANEQIPFDVAATRTVQLDHHDLDSVAHAKQEIIRHIKSVEQNPSEVDNPISVAIDLQFLRQSDNPLEKSNAEIMALLQQLKTGVEDLVERTTEAANARKKTEWMDELAPLFQRFAPVLKFVLSTPDGQRLFQIGTQTAILSHKAPDGNLCAGKEGIILTIGSSVEPGTVQCITCAGRIQQQV